jgi:hypothetical protein
LIDQGAALMSRLDNDADCCVLAMVRVRFTGEAISLSRSSSKLSKENPF